MSFYLLYALLLPMAFGLVGSLTPYALGINAVFLGTVTGRPRAVRIGQWLLFALARAAFLTLLGLLFGLLGATVGDFVRGYQKVIAVGLIVLGALLVLSRWQRLSWPALSLSEAQDRAHGGALALGAPFGLDIPACTSPLVIALLAQTVLIGNYAAGALALFVFGLGMSLPLLAMTLAEGADRWLVALSRRYRTAFYVAAGGLLMLLGIAELSPRAMMLVGGWLNWIFAPFLGA